MNQRIFQEYIRSVYQKNILTLQLVGVLYIDPSDASGTFYYEVKNQSWSQYMLKKSEIVTDFLPKYKLSYENIGYVREKIVEEFELNANTILLTGAGDNPAVAIRAGAVKPNSCSISIGIIGTVFVPYSEYSALQNNAVHNFANCDGGYYFFDACYR